MVLCVLFTVAINVFISYFFFKKRKEKKPAYPIYRRMKFLESFIPNSKHLSKQ